MVLFFIRIRFRFSNCQGMHDPVLLHDEPVAGFSGFHPLIQIIDMAILGRGKLLDEFVFGETRDIIGIPARPIVIDVQRSHDYAALVITTAPTEA